MAFQKFEDHALLIIFYRNPELGKVKTRLAVTVGDAKAFSIYLLLADHTRRITEKLTVHKALFYSHYIDTTDSWPEENYEKFVQSGEDLGERMMQSFKVGFNAGYKSICIIGTDCLELTSMAIEEAFAQLQTHDVVLGPANDGGYYLLGMNQLYPALFKNKIWSTDTVLLSTLNDLKTLGLNFFQLSPLNDIDEEKDIPASLR